MFALIRAKIPITVGIQITDKTDIRMIKSGFIIEWPVEFMASEYKTTIKTTIKKPDIIYSCIQIKVWKPVFKGNFACYFKVRYSNGSII